MNVLLEGIVQASVIVSIGAVIFFGLFQCMIAGSLRGCCGCGGF